MIEIRRALNLLPSQTGGKIRSNIGIADVDIAGLPKQTLKSILDDVYAPKGFVTESTSQIFNTYTINDIARSTDTEAKILENVAKQLGNNYNATGKITLFTERPACDSCKSVIQQFKDKYPNIKLEVIPGEGKYYNYPNQ